MIHFSCSLSRGVAASALVAISLTTSSIAHADRLVAGGVTLSGSVTALSGDGVEFQPDFAKGAMLVPWESVEDLATDASYQVLYGDEQEADAPVSGYRDGKLLVGEAAVSPESIVSVAALSGDAPGFAENMRRAFRYWHGGVAAGVNLQQATTDNFGALFSVNALRANGPTRLMLGASYRYATQRSPDNAPPKTKRTNDAVAGSVRGEYDITKNIFAYGSTDALYDAIQNLSLRAIPKAGAGYTLWQREPEEGVRDFLQVEAGVGWVYEKYIDNGTAPGPVLADNDYVTMAFGAAAGVLLPRGMTFDWRFDYLPSVSDFTGDYVVRTAAALTVPLIAPLSARFSIADTYDSTPAIGSDKNSLNLDTSLALDW